MCQFWGHPVWWNNLWNKWILNLKWKSETVIDGENGDSEYDNMPYYAI